MLRRLRLIFSWACLTLFLLIAWLLTESFHSPPMLLYTGQWTQTLFAINTGCFEIGNAVVFPRRVHNPGVIYFDEIDRSYEPPNAPAARGWHTQTVDNGDGGVQLSSFFPGYAVGDIVVGQYGPLYHGVILGGYWVLIGLLIPAIPLIWRTRRMIFLIIFPIMAMVASLLIWHRSFRVSDLIVIQRRVGFSLLVESDSGVVIAGVTNEPSNDFVRAAWRQDQAGKRPYLHPYIARAGRVIIPKTLALELKPPGRMVIWFADWLVAVPICLGAIPIAGFEIRRRFQKRQFRRRSKAGLCGNCGYDLRASAERCPECGARPSTAAV